MLVLLLLVLPAISLAGSCEDCVNSGQTWCISPYFQCVSPTTNCDTRIKNWQNCPRNPNATFAYDDNFARKIVLPLNAAIYTENPSICLKNNIPTATFYKRVKVQCRTGKPHEFCTAYAAYDTTMKTIMVVFAGTETIGQLIGEMDDLFVGKKPFFDSGNVYAYFYNAFYYLWNGGLEDSVRQLQYLYPDYSLIAVGYSLGGATCTIFASHVVKVNMWSPEQIRLVTFGQPRTGDKKFAAWHDDKFPYSYRIVHHKDNVPHIPPMGGPDEVFHHRYEVWYNNNMAPGQNYTVCYEADGDYCSNTQIDLKTEDHFHYFTNIATYVARDCVLH